MPVSLCICVRVPIHECIVGSWLSGLAGGQARRPARTCWWTRPPTPRRAAAGGARARKPFSRAGKTRRRARGVHTAVRVSERVSVSDNFFYIILYIYIYILCTYCNLYTGDIASSWGWRRASGARRSSSPRPRRRQGSPGPHPPPIRRSDACVCRPRHRDTPRCRGVSATPPPPSSLPRSLGEILARSPPNPPPALPAGLPPQHAHARTHTHTRTRTRTRKRTRTHTHTHTHTHTLRRQLEPWGDRAAPLYALADFITARKN